MILEATSNFFPATGVDLDKWKMFLCGRDLKIISDHVLHLD